MRLFSLFFLLGTLLIQFNTELLSLTWLSVAFTCVVFVTLLINYKCNYKRNDKHKEKSKRSSPWTMLFVAVLAGLLLATFTAQTQLNHRLDTQYEGKDVLLQGNIEDIPKVSDDGVRFRLKVDKAFLVDEPHVPISISGIVRLGWFKNKTKTKGEVNKDEENKAVVNAGERWQFRARLKRPSGFYNPGGFDYEKWLFTERVNATGYVRARKEEWRNQNKRLEESPWWSLNHLRQTIHQKFQNSLADTEADKPAAAVLSAMVVAVRSDLDDKQWKQLQQTGTSHLIAISGLHIAVVAGFAFLPILLLWRWFPRLNERVPVRVAGAIAGVIFATVYAMLAGFTLPTQRALLMVIIAMLGLVSRKNLESYTILAAALLAVLVLDPLAAMTASFWLSFLAVALILIFLKRQIEQPRFQLIKLQMFLSLAMLPLTLLFFNSASLTSPLANLLAIPWVSFVVVPLSLLAVVLMPISTFLSEGLLAISAWAIKILFNGLSILSSSPLAEFQMAEIPTPYLILAFLGVLFLLLPKGFPARWLGFVAFFPAVFFSVPTPVKNTFNYTLLDVGQGMASVIQTKNHTLIYDTGARLSKTYDIGKLVVAPYLKSKGIYKVDMLMLSHEDMDHRGGTESLLKEITAARIVSSDLTLLADYRHQHQYQHQYKIKPCVRGDHWQWDGVDFEMLSPFKGLEESDNNLSCVLRVSNQHHSLLLTGDIEKRVEQELVESMIDSLDSDVLSVPHHGSKTSSSLAFIQAVSPSIGLITAGYRNRFGHPKAEVIQRYAENDVSLLNTLNQGAIVLYFPDSDEAITTKSYRKIKRGFWTR